MLRNKVENLFDYLKHSFLINAKKATVEINGKEVQLVNCTVEEKVKDERFKLRCKLGDIAEEIETLQKQNKQHPDQRNEEKINELKEKSAAIKQQIANLNDKPLVGHVLNRGGCKAIFNVDNNVVIAVRNLDVDYTKENSELLIQHWQRIVREEIEMAKRLHSLGLETQSYDKIMISAQDKSLPVLMMPHFEAMAHTGNQPRDSKNKAVFGSSMLFGHKANINKDYLMALLQGPIEDTICLLKNGVWLSYDSFNLIIKNTDHTPPYDINKPKLYGDLQQKIRLFFYDFSSKENSLRHELWPNDASLDVKKKKIEEYAQIYFEFAFSAITFALTSHEIEQICQEAGLSKADRFYVVREIKAVCEQINSDLIKYITEQSIRQLTSTEMIEKQPTYSIGNLLASSLSQVLNPIPSFAQNSPQATNDALFKKIKWQT